jgi:hypothetical protein
MFFKDNDYGKLLHEKNAQINGDHEVHKAGFSWTPNIENRKLSGDFLACYDAVKEAKK